jgi:hypothetical protein
MKAILFVQFLFKYNYIQIFILLTYYDSHVNL